MSSDAITEIQQKAELQRDNAFYNRKVGMVSLVTSSQKASPYTRDFAFIITKKLHKLSRLLSEKIFLVQLCMARRCQTQHPTINIQTNCL